MLVETRPNDAAEATNERATVVLASIPSDSHMWNLVFLEMLLTEAGHTVINLGPCTPPQLVADAVDEHRASAVVISSVNGHAHLDAPAIASALRQHPRNHDLTLIIGGKIGVHGNANIRHAPHLIEAGFNAVFESTATPISSQKNELMKLLRSPEATLAKRPTKGELE